MITREIDIQLEAGKCARALRRNIKAKDTKIVKEYLHILVAAASDDSINYLAHTKRLNVNSIFKNGGNRNV